MSSNIFRMLDLQLFAEGGAAAGEGAAANGATADTGMPATSAKGVKNPLADVKYGVQEEAQTADAQQTTADPAEVSPEARQQRFEELIKGEFKDLYDARVQDTVQKRLKSTKETVEKYNELAPTLEMLSRKYGVDASDIKALNKAIEDDDAYYEEEALEKGVSVEQLKQIRKMERENSELKQAMMEREKQERAEKNVAEWMEQARAAAKIFPGLDLGDELKDREFIKLLESGVSVETAYFAKHHRELVPQAMQFTAKQVEQKLANKIMAGGARPTENGVNPQATAVVKSDVTQLSKADRQEIIRRVQRGEKIKF